MRDRADPGGRRAHRAAARCAGPRKAGDSGGHGIADGRARAVRWACVGHGKGPGEGHARRDRRWAGLAGVDGDRRARGGAGEVGVIDGMGAHHIARRGERGIGPAESGSLRRAPPVAWQLRQPFIRLIVQANPVADEAVGAAADLRLAGDRPGRRTGAAERPSESAQPNPDHRSRLNGVGVCGCGRRIEHSLGMRAVLGAVDQQTLVGAAQGITAEYRGSRKDERVAPTIGPHRVVAHVDRRTAHVRVGTETAVGGFDQVSEHLRRCGAEVEEDAAAEETVAVDARPASRRGELTLEAPNGVVADRPPRAETELDAVRRNHRLGAWRIGRVLLPRPPSRMSEFSMVQMVPASLQTIPVF